LPPTFTTVSVPGLGNHEAQSLPLQYGPDVALSTLSPCRYLHEPKTRFPVGGWPLPGRELHPLDAPDLSWRAVESLDVLRDGVVYEDLGTNYYDERKKEPVVRNAVKRLERLGYKVTVEAA